MGQSDIFIVGRHPVFVDDVLQRIAFDNLISWLLAQILFVGLGVVVILVTECEGIAFLFIGGERIIVADFGRPVYKFIACENRLVTHQEILFPGKKQRAARYFE